MEEKINKSPVNKRRGWNKMREYIDDEGSVFNFGVFNEEETNKKKDEYLTKKIKENPLSEQDELDLKNQIKRQNEAIKILMEKISSIEAGKQSDGVDYSKITEAFVAAQSRKGLTETVYDTGKLPNEDILQEEVNFTSYGYGRLFIDKRNSNGLLEKTPGGKKIFFKNIGHKVTGYGKDRNRNYVCGYKTRFKSEVDWFRTHPEYGLTIFEDVGKAINTDVVFMKIAAEELKKVAVLDKNMIVNNAKAYNIELGGTLEDIKNQIAFARAKKRIEEIKIKSEEILKKNEEIKVFG